MSGLPQSALDVLSEVGESFAEGPIMAARTKSLTALSVRRSLRTAARAASSSQIAAVLYDPGHADPLVVLKVDDLERLAQQLKSATDNDGERRNG